MHNHTRYSTHNKHLLSTCKCVLLLLLLRLLLLLL
jgi:hypothetical protein